MTNIPTRSPNVKMAENILRKDSVKLFVYIEDRNLKKTYEKIIHRLTSLPFEQLRIENLNSRKNVEIAFGKWLENSEVSKKSIFIIDRDFNHMKNEIEINHDNFVQLEYYTIENYLITEKGLVSFVGLKKPDDTEEECIEKVSYQEWITEFYDSFYELFIHFALAFKYELRDNCSQSPHVYLAKASYKSNMEQINRYIESVKNLCLDKGLDYQAELSGIKSKFIEGDSIQYEKLIHGKYKFTAALKYLHYLVGGKPFDEDLCKLNFVDYMNYDDLHFLKFKLDKIVSYYNI